MISKMWFSTNNRDEYMVVIDGKKIGIEKHYLKRYKISFDYRCK